MDQSTILIVGIVVFSLLIGGVVFTILEFRKMGQHPEEYQAPPMDEKQAKKKAEDIVE